MVQEVNQKDSSTFTGNTDQTKGVASDFRVLIETNVFKNLARMFEGH